MFLNGEDRSTVELFERRTAENYRSILSDVDLLVIDLVEERGESLSDFEMKWKHQSKGAPKAWKKAYPDSTFQVINPESYLAFVGITP